MTDPNFTPDFSAINADILADPSLNLPAESTSSAPESASADTPVQAASPTQIPSDPAQPSAQAAPQEPPLDPQEQERGYLRDADYRKKTMALADERRAFEAQQQSELAQRQAYEQRIQQAEYERRLLNDPNFLAQRWNELQANTPDPNTPITLAQAQQLVAQQSQAVLNQARTEQTAAFFETEKERYKLEYQNDMSRHVTTIVKDNPILKRIPGINDTLDKEAKDLGPKSVDEYKQFIKDRAEWHTSDWKKFIGDHEQAAIMRHTSVSKPAINPPGGHVPATQAAPKHKFGSQNLHDSIKADLEAGLL